MWRYARHRNRHPQVCALGRLDVDVVNAIDDVRFERK
jgi:hypothetical protein